VQEYNDIGVEGGEALGEALQVNTSLQILNLVSVFVLFLFVFVCARVLLLRGLRAADVCCAGAQQNRRPGIHCAWESADGQYQCAETGSCECIPVVLFVLGFVLRVFCCCEESGRLTFAMQGFIGLGANEGCRALGEALKVNTSVKILTFVSVFVLVCVGFPFARVLMLRGVRAADVCGAEGQRYRRLWRIFSCELH
jgi:hypothetical protein